MDASIYFSSTKFVVKTVEDVAKLNISSIRFVKKKSYEYRLGKITGPDNSKVIIDVSPFFANGIYAQESGNDHFIPIANDANPILYNITKAINARLLPLLKEGLAKYLPNDKLSQTIIAGDDDIIKDPYIKKDDNDDESCFFLKNLPRSLLFTVKNSNVFSKEQLTKESILPEKGLYKVSIELSYVYMCTTASKPALISYRGIQVIFCPMIEDKAPQTLIMSLDEFPTIIDTITTDAFINSSINAADANTVLKLMPTPSELDEFDVSVVKKIKLNDDNVTKPKKTLKLSTKK